MNCLCLRVNWAIYIEVANCVFRIFCLNMSRKYWWTNSMKCIKLYNVYYIMEHIKKKKEKQRKQRGIKTGKTWICMFVDINTGATQRTRNMWARSHVIYKISDANKRKSIYEQHATNLEYGFILRIMSLPRAKRILRTDVCYMLCESSVCGFVKQQIKVRLHAREIWIYIYIYIYVYIYIYCPNFIYIYIYI